MLLVRAAAAAFCPGSLQLIAGSSRALMRCDGSIASCNWACCTQPDSQGAYVCAPCSCTDGDTSYTGDMCSLLASTESLQDFCAALRGSYSTMSQCSKPIIQEVYDNAGCGGCSLRLHCRCSSHAMPCHHHGSVLFCDCCTCWGIYT